MWQAPNQRVRALQNAKKRQQDRLKRPIHIRRIRAGIKIVAISDAEQPFSEVHLVLNDISPGGIGFYAPKGIHVGQEITLSLDEPKSIQLRGKVIWSQEIKTHSHVLYSPDYAYRVGVRFLFANNEEKEAVQNYCVDLFKNYLYADSPM